MGDIIGLIIGLAVAFLFVWWAFGPLPDDREDHEDDL
jgi:hypothetical protein